MSLFVLRTRRPPTDHLFSIILKVTKLYRVFLNLGFAKPMFCNPVLFTENDGNHENDENDEDNSDSHKQVGRLLDFAEITESTEMTKTTRTQGAKHRFPKT